MLLLEVGLWELLRIIAENLTRDDPAGWPRELSELVPQLGARTGERYQSLVAQCLDLNGDHIVKDVEFVLEVLDPLDEVVNLLRLRSSALVGPLLERSSGCPRFVHKSSSHNRGLLAQCLNRGAGIQEEIVYSQMRIIWSSLERVLSNFPAAASHHRDDTQGY